MFSYPRPNTAYTPCRFTHNGAVIRVIFQDINQVFYFRNKESFFEPKELYDRFDHALIIILTKNP